MSKKAITSAALRLAKLAPVVHPAHDSSAIFRRYRLAFRAYKRAVDDDRAARGLRAAKWPFGA